MKKYFLFAAFFPLLCGALYASDDDLIVIQADVSHFQCDDIFQTMARGEGKCTVTGSRNWSGGCSIQQSIKGSLERFDIYLEDEKAYFHVEQIKILAYRYLCIVVLVNLEWPTSLQMSQILKMSLAKPQRTPRKTFAVLAYMDNGQGREQDAEALRLGERKCFLHALSV
jgi:hypothetical protein